MIPNFFKIAFRNLQKNKIFSFINILGLAIGLSCFMLISAYVYQQLSYDKFPVAAKNIYRVNLSVTGNGDLAVYPDVDVAVGEGIKNAFPEVKSCTRLVPAGNNFVKYNDKQFKEEHFAFVDSNFMGFFSLPLVSGNPQEALAAPNSIVVSKNFEHKYFGDQPALGKSVIIGTNTVYKITGVFDKIPDNAHFHFDAFLSLCTFPRTNLTWSNIGYYTYLTLNENADPKKLQAKFPQLVSKYVVPEIVHDMGVSLAEARKSVNTFVFTLVPLTDIHLRSNTKYELEPNGDIEYVYIFSALAVFILMLACINFTNLSTAGAVKRSREVGIRKVMGSMKRQLVFQFLSESVLLTFLATGFAFLLTFLLIPYFNRVSGENIPFGFFTSVKSVGAAMGLTLLVGVLAGLYPSFFMSSFNTIRVLKGSGPGAASNNKLRSGLVIFQFCVSTTLIFATIVVYQQLHYMQNKNLGYDKEQVVYLPDAYLLQGNQEAFRQTLLQDKSVVSATISRSIPGSLWMDGTEVYPKNEKGNGVEIHSNIFHIDENYLSTLGIHLIAGRNFSKQFPTDVSAVLINESAVRQLGWTDTNPLGKSIVRSGQQEYKVIGVVADFHYASVKQKIAPLMLMLGNNNGGLILKIKAEGVKNFVDRLKTEWTAFQPDGPFTYTFLNESFASLYRSEENTGRVFSSFTVIAIIIASLGLFGLAAFITEQRSKEIGIRKVLGANLPQLLFMVSKEFLILVALAFIIAIPVTWWTMNVWLANFAYRIQINPWVFPLSGLAAVLIAALTIGFQAIKASVANPVKSLRSE
jgi:putative ABC transport system permease protein